MSNIRIRAKKSLGQNFLTDPSYLRRIVDAAHVCRSDQVLEIGPGLGHLTGELAALAGKVVVIELDDRLIPELRTRFTGNPRVEIIHADALSFDLRRLEGPWKVVANLPYYIATPLIDRMLVNHRKFTALTVMVQKEVAERLAAAPGGRDYGFLSVRVQFRADVRIDFTVPAGAFTPRPKVDSAVVTITVPSVPRYQVRDERFFLSAVSAAFSQRRKTLRNSLASLGIARQHVEAAARSAGIDLSKRPETLSVADFCSLSDALLEQPRDNTEK